VTIEATADTLTVRAETADTSFLARIFGSSPTERVTLRLPRAISLVARGINGSVFAGEIDGSVEVKGVNGKVDIARASGAATFKGINGNIAVGLTYTDLRTLMGFYMARQGMFDSFLYPDPNDNTVAPADQTLVVITSRAFIALPPALDRKAPSSWIVPPCRRLKTARGSHPH